MSKKLSELGAASGVKGSDLTYIVQDGSSMRASIAQVQATPRISTCAARRRISVAGSNQTGVSVIMQFPSLAQFDAVQLVYANMDASSTYQVDIAKAAAAPTHANNGTGLTWSSVTFNDNGNVVPVATGTGADIVPGILFSDVMPLQSVARTDGGTPYLLQTRSYSAGSVNTGGLSGTEFGLINALNSGREQWAARYVAGDQVTSISSQAPQATGNIMYPQAVVFYSNSAAYRNILWGGDSLVRGYGSTAHANGFLEQAVVLAGASPVRIPYNYGQSGQKHTASIATLKKALAGFTPDIVGLQAHSINDITTAGMDKSLAETLSFLQYAKALRVPVILSTVAAASTVTGGNNTYRLALNDKVRALCATGAARLLDIASIIDDPANTAQINASYNYGDGIHFNDAGYAAIAAVLAPMI